MSELRKALKTVLVMAYETLDDDRTPYDLPFMGDERRRKEREEAVSVVERHVQNMAGLPEGDEWVTVSDPIDPVAPCGYCGNAHPRAEA